MRHPLFLASLACAVASCFAPVIEQQCERDADCGSGWLCIAAQCTPPQMSNDDGGVGGGSSTGGGGTTDGGGVGTGGGTSVGGGTAGGTSDGGGTGVGGGGGGGTSLCNANNCSGCCTGDICVPLNAQNGTVCGLKGNICGQCAMGSQCTMGQCTGGFCNSANCPSGCCSGNGCVPFTSQSTLSCGANGSACMACGNNTACNSGVCEQPVCNSQTCLGGCCQNNKCVPFSQQSASACGVAGLTCQACTPGEGCTNGVCTGTSCGPGNCMGCCFNGSCLRGTDPFACGGNGGACATCGAGDTCTNGACQGCGPGNCMGCCQNGFCQMGNQTAACGIQGSACTSCPAGQSCQFGKCSPVTMTVRVGDPCANDSDCATLGANALCKLKTSTGSGVYQNGYCTLKCGSGNGCPMGSICETVPSRGETDSVCLARCGGMSGQMCRNPGYSCFAFGTMGGQQACWIFPQPPLTDGGVITVDGGIGGLPVGSACTDNGQCQPQTSVCTPASIGGFNTGYIGGYCTDTCSAGQPCPAGSQCISESIGGVSASTCKSLCFNPGGGQGACRTSYVCEQNPSGSTIGWCGPRCNNQTLPCSTGTCDPTTGYCK